LAPGHPVPVSVGLIKAVKLYIPYKVHHPYVQGCQMVCFQTKYFNLGKFWRVLQWKMFIYFTAIGNILRPLGIFYGHLVYFAVIWYIFPRFGIFFPVLVCCTQLKSGNPASVRF
jgi:hypothetical protein